jgi:hypothetical protein
MAAGIRAWCYTMLTGKRFRLKSSTLCIGTSGGKRRAVEVPEGEIVKVLSGPRPDDRRMLDIQWNSIDLTMFTDDLQARGEEIREGSSAG